MDNLGQAVRTQLVDGLFADLLQVVRFLRVYGAALRAWCSGHDTYFYNVGYDTDNVGYNPGYDTYFYNVGFIFFKVFLQDI